MIKEAIKNICKKILPNPYYANFRVDREILKDLIELGYSLYEIEQSVRDKFIELIDDTKLEHKEKDADDNKTNLDSKYKWLDKTLYCSIGQPIKLGINEDMVGSYEYNYILKNYTINGIYNSITLELERKGDDYKISFTEIQDINWNETKVWLYLKDTNWKFYNYHVDEIKLSSLEENFKSKNIELQEDIQIYMQYKDVNNLIYHVEKQKYVYRYLEMDITQKEITDKLDNKMILLNILDKESSNKGGTIYAYSKSGQQGIFDYVLRKEELYIMDMLPQKHSQGVGSKVLEFMEETALRYNIKELAGMLSPSDFGHKERLLYFYRKNGFIVNDLESGIRKKIN
ncbi:hypothetical protein [Clostridium estertheticum]|uniref:hypothetical protein n=1 Tax=Clostridium estertheticum TaxID=238834 RepID=UPI001C7E0CED|nr:hypothetical protein [Clostridium estertheticum]MBX4261943.1 hypothetical protein [Clostridium estertheticum]